MKRFCSVFQNPKSIIGMIHVGALPGEALQELVLFFHNLKYESAPTSTAVGIRTPKYEGSVDKLVDVACKESEIYKNCCVDSVMIENMHDVPYIRPQDFQPEVVSIMSRIATEVRRVLSNETPCGIQVLAGGNKEGISIAKACNLQFVRAEGFVFSHIGDEGFLDASAGPLLRYRKTIDAESVLVFGDIKKKHSSHQITSDLSIEETAKAAEFFLCDGVILTGTSTGSPADQEELKILKNSINIPVIIGSGVTFENLESYLLADAFIIGSHFKEKGMRLTNALDGLEDDAIRKVNEDGESSSHE